MSHLNLTSPLTAAPVINLFRTSICTLEDVEKSITETPTSGSSSSALNSATLRDQSTSPYTAGYHPRSGVVSNITRACATTTAKKQKGNNNQSFSTSLQSSNRRSIEALELLQKKLKESPLSPKFDYEFYDRVEEYLDQEGLHIIMPSLDHIQSQAREAVRRFIIERTVSEKGDLSDDGEDQNENVDYSSPSLKSNIFASTLVKRRASLSHTSSNEIAAVRESTFKKSAFHTYREPVMISEERETPVASNRNSKLTAWPAPEELNGDLFSRESLGGVSPELRSSLSRKSQRLSSCGMISPKIELQSLTKLSPLHKLPNRNPLGLSPLNENKKFSFYRASNSPLTSLIKKSGPFDQKLIKKQTTLGDTSFAEILSKSSESSGCATPGN